MNYQSSPHTLSNEINSPEESKCMRALLLPACRQFKQPETIFPDPHSNESESYDCQETEITLELKMKRLTDRSDISPIIQHRQSVHASEMERAKTKRFNCHMKTVNRPEREAQTLNRSKKVTIIGAERESFDVGSVEPGDKRLPNFCLHY